MAACLFTSSAVTKQRVAGSIPTMGAFQRGALPVSAWVLQLPLERLNIRLIGKSELSVGVSAVGCLSLCVAMNWQLLLGVPGLGPQTAAMDSTTPTTLSAVMENGWTVVLLFVLSFPRILCHVHLRDFANIVEFRCSSLPGRRRLIFSILAPNVQKRLCCFECRSSS